MNARDKAKKAAQVLDEVRDVAEELEEPVRGLIGLFRRWRKRIQARRAARKAKK